MGRPRVNDGRGTGARRRRVELAKTLRADGKTWDQVAAELGVSPTTAYHYVFPRERSRTPAGRPEFSGHRERCKGCGKTLDGCVRFAGGWTCPSCLLADNDPLTIERFVEARHNERIYGW